MDSSQSGEPGPTAGPSGIGSIGSGIKVEKHRSFSQKLKLEIIEYAEKFSNRGAGRKFEVDEACVRRWRKQKTNILELVQKGGMAAKTPRISKGGRKSASPLLDRLVLEWVREKRGDSVRISTTMLQKRAREIATGNLEVQEQLDRSIHDEFHASRGWVVRFMKRNNLSFRRKTTQGQQRPVRESYLIRNFILFVRGLRIKNRYLETDLVAMDETAVWMDAPGDTTITESGARTIKVKTTKHENNRATVCLSARADGTKNRPWIVFKGKRIDRDILNSNVQAIVRMSDNGWMTQELTTEFIQGISIINRKRLLVWDAFRCHTSDLSKQKARSVKVQMAVIPGGCTGVIQVRI